MVSCSSFKVVGLPKRFMCAPRQELVQNPDAMLRWAKMRGGSMACSGFQIWIRKKTIRSTKASTSSAIMRASLHWIQ